jgi:hypothetical protein
MKKSCTYKEKEEKEEKLFPFMYWITTNIADH